jgi:hypothetical protein
MCWYRSQRRGPREVSLLYRDRHRSLQGYSPKVIRATEGAYGVRTEVMADLHTSCSRDDSKQRLLTLPWVDRKNKPTLSTPSKVATVTLDQPARMITMAGRP